jgi:hypothetical protein
MQNDILVFCVILISLDKRWSKWDLSNTSIIIIIALTITIVNAAS